MARKRYNSIDIAKGLGILLVVYGHTHNCPIVDIIFTFHMPLFFILSSFFIHDDMSPKDFLYRKCRTLLVPFIFFYSLAFMFKIPYFFLFRSAQDTLEQLHSGYLIEVVHVNGPLWFLACLFIVSVIYFSLRRLIRHSIWRNAAIISIFLLGSYLAENRFPFPNYIVQSSVFLVFFPIGQIYWENKDKILRYSIFLSCILLLAFIILWWKVPVHYNLSILHYSHPILFVLYGLVGSFFIIFISDIIDKIGFYYVKKLLVYLGKSSLVIMSLHLCFGFFYPLIVKTTDVFVLQGLMESLVQIVVSCLLGEILKRKMPYIFSASKVGI